MLRFAWLVLRQARAALRRGHLEEALRLLPRGPAANHQRFADLRQQLVRALVERGEKHLRHDDVAAAWKDLLLAEQADADDGAPQRLRQALNRFGVAEVRALLEAGEPHRAVEAIAQLWQRGVRRPELEPLEEAAREWMRARELADRGEFAWALQLGHRIRRLWTGPLDSWERFEQDLAGRQRGFSPLLVELHEAAQKEEWQRVVHIAERLLPLAPQHAETRKLRGQAWRAIEPVTVAMEGTAPGQGPKEAQAAAPPAQQYLLWIDGVGGYLLCLDARVTIGQASPEARVDVALFADVSRHHATISRDTEGYVLEGVRSVQVNGQKMERALLQSGDRVTLGTSCQFRFWQPVPVSATARLDLVSGHRLRLAVDSVILMADSLVLGPGSQVHVAIPDLKQPLVLYRLKEGLGIRYPGTLIINGQPFKDRGQLEPGATVTGEDFSLALEAVGSKPPKV